MRYQAKRQPFRPGPELESGKTSRYPVVIVGAGPVGLTAAIDLAMHSIRVVLLDDNDEVSVGSRAICWAKRTLEIFDRLGVGERMLAKGVTWQVGRVYHRGKELFNFDLLPEQGHKFPAFINLPQYYVEEYLIERCADFPGSIDLRFRHKAVGLTNGAGGARLDVETPAGNYSLDADYILACDGAKSPLRRMLGLELEGEAFEERFLIADIEMEADFPSERRFWFEPTFHEGQSALLHKQPDNIYRIDLQLGPEADPEAEKKPEKVIARIARAMEGRPFELDWVSIYSFQCSRLERFIHDRVIFAGDSAHIVSPFGARGGNGGIQDVDNLCWKLARVLKGEAGPGLLASYDEERGHGADENIGHSSRATRFMSPASGAERCYRDSVLELAATFPFARQLINSGRLSKPCSLAGLALQTPPQGTTIHPVGAACLDAPLPDGSWMLEKLGGEFLLLSIGAPPVNIEGLKTLQILVPGPELADRYGQGHYLVRPDQHVAAFWPHANTAEIRAALRRACGGGS